MRSGVALAALLAFAAPAGARGQSQKHAAVKSKKKKRRYHSSATEVRGWDSSHEPQLKGTPTLVLESVDLPNAKAIAWVTGVSRPPDARMFTLHDARDRHYMALGARCAETLSEGQFRCELELPRFYLKQKIVGLTVHIHHEEIRADAARVATEFAAVHNEPALAAAPAAATGEGAAKPVRANALTVPGGWVAPTDGSARKPDRAAAAADPGLAPNDKADKPAVAPPPVEPNHDTDPATDDTAEDGEE